MSWENRLWCSFFSAEATLCTRIFYTALAIVVFIYAVIAVCAPLIAPECPTQNGDLVGREDTDVEKSVPK